MLRLPLLPAWSAPARQGVAGRPAISALPVLLFLPLAAAQSASAPEILTQSSPSKGPIAFQAPLVTVQGEAPALLPSLVLPPGATTEPPMFGTLMRMGDSAMVRGDILRARAMYERAAAIHPTTAAPCIAAGKTYDPNVLPQFGGHFSLADAARARGWYERAQALGDAQAAGLLASLR